MIYGEIYVNFGFVVIIFVNMFVVVLIVLVLFLNEKVKLMQIVGLIIVIIVLMGIFFEEMNISIESYWQGIIVFIFVVLIYVIIYI